MAKESMKAREVKRAKLVAKYAERRAATEARRTVILMKLCRHCLRMLHLCVCTIAAN